VIPTILIIGVIFGFAHAVTHRVGITLAGGAIALGGWWLLLATTGDVGVTFANGFGSAVLVIGNYLVATLAGWGLARTMRSLFGMTTE